MNDSVAGEPVDLDRIADALEGASERLRERLAVEAQRVEDVRDLKDAVSALVISTEALVIAVKGNTQRNRQFRVLATLSLAVLLAGVVTTVILLARLNGIASTNRATNAAIASCTVPSGSCYQASRAQTAAAIAVLEQEIERANAAQATCERRTTSYPAVLACIQHAVRP